MNPLQSSSSDNAPLFARIKVVGVGGGGSNAVDRMIEKGLKGVEFVSINTDAQALARYSAPARLQIGEKTTRGLGAGGQPEVGGKAAEESETALREMLRDTDMVFITAGMGGGTGTGAAPVVARLARSLGILTIGIVTLPFSFEGKRRADNALAGINALKDKVDTLITIPNDRLLLVADQRVSLKNAFGIADDVLYQGIQAISELITVPGLINLDFADARSIMQDGGAALMSVGHGKGEHRARQAAEQAIANPLLDVTIQGAQGILLNVTGGPDMSLYEVVEAASVVRDIAHPDANVIFGAVVDPALKDEMRISIIATGFQGVVELSQAKAPQVAASRPVQESGYSDPKAGYGASPYIAPLYSENRTPVPPTPPADFPPRKVNTDDLDVPTFLRRRTNT
ncbi:MAG TPA: cell division protein FtsZ [Anaerolineales bacterium]